MAGKVIDLSLKIEHGMPVYPGDTPVAVESYHQIEVHGSNSSRVIMGTHAGTHLDAPWHMLADGRKLDEIPLDRCIGPAVVADLTSRGQEALIEVSDLKRYERFITEGTRLLMRTDWSKHFGTEAYYEQWPALTEDASQWLVERGIWLLGMETPSVDRRKHHGNHEILLGAEVVLVEGLANLSAVQGLQIFFAALPLSLGARDGSPVRAIAMEEEQNAPDLRELSEALQEAKPYSASMTLGTPPVKGIPIGRQFFRS